MKRTWTDSDIEKFKELYPVTSPQDLMKIFVRTHKAINSKAKILGLRKDPEFYKCKIFTPEEIEYLIKNYPHIRTDTIAKKFNRSCRSIYCKARSMGLNKTAEFMISPDAGNWEKGCTIGKEFWYKKGHVPANKGKKMSDELYEKCKHTMFKKGNLPGNTLKDGEITIRNNKIGTPYFHIRLSLAKWEYLHRVLWEKENGKIPKGMMVKFKDGDSMNCKIQNLYICSRSQNMIDNQIHLFSPELKKAIKLIHKIQKHETN